MIIINADDWGRTRPETDAALSCLATGRITSVTAMVFMKDSERAADLAKQTGVAVGLHLNLDERLASDRIPQELSERHESVVRFLKRSRYSWLLYHPLLRNKIDFVYKAQVEEFNRLYGRAPTHVDGHRHMHLCANMVLDRVIPRGLKVRRSFSFWPGEKSALNRGCRRLLDEWLRRRYVVTDYFFSLAQCLQEGRMERVVKLAKQAKVELMTHPGNAAESTYLQSGEYLELFRDVPKGSYAEV